MGNGELEMGNWDKFRIFTWGASDFKLLYKAFIPLILISISLVIRSFFINCIRLDRSSLFLALTFALVFLNYRRR